MDTLIRVIGCLVLTSAIIACPVCLGLILASPWDDNNYKIMSFATMILMILCFAEFFWIFGFFI